MNDSEILQLIKDGDERGLRALESEYFGRCRDAAAEILVNSDVDGNIAGQCAYDALMKLWNGRAGIDEVNFDTGSFLESAARSIAQSRVPRNNPASASVSAPVVSLFASAVPDQSYVNQSAAPALGVFAPVSSDLNAFAAPALGVFAPAPSDINVSAPDLFDPNASAPQTDGGEADAASPAPKNRGKKFKIIAAAAVAVIVAVAALITFISINNRNSRQSDDRKKLPYTTGGVVAKSTPGRSAAPSTTPSGTTGIDRETDPATSAATDPYRTDFAPTTPEPTNTFSLPTLEPTDKFHSSDVIISPTERVKDESRVKIASDSQITDPTEEQSRIINVYRQLYPDYPDREPLMTQDGESIFFVPEEWYYADYPEIYGRHEFRQFGSYVLCVYIQDAEFRFGVFSVDNYQLTSVVKRGNMLNADGSGLYREGDGNWTLPLKMFKSNGSYYVATELYIVANGTNVRSDTVIYSLPTLHELWNDSVVYERSDSGDTDNYRFKINDDQLDVYALAPRFPSGVEESYMWSIKLTSVDVNGIYSNHLKSVRVPYQDGNWLEFTVDAHKEYFSINASGKTGFIWANSIVFNDTTRIAYVLCVLDGVPYVLMYTTSTVARTAIYTYSLFAYSEELGFYVEDSAFVSFSLGGESPLPVSAMVYFAERVNSYLETNQIIASTRGDTLILDGNTPLEEYQELTELVLDRHLIPDDIVPGLADLPMRERLTIIRQYLYDPDDDDIYLG